MNAGGWLDRILFDADPTGVFAVAFVAAVFLLTVGRLVWRIAYLAAAVTGALLVAAWRGRRERLELERRRAAARGRRPGPNWLAADLRRRREGAPS